MQSHHFMLLLLLMVASSAAIECYRGLKLIAGQPIGTDTITCDNSQAFCYNMSASAGGILDVVKVGCSMWRCMLARDTCVSTTFRNVPISLCCCSSNLCNVPENRGIRQQSVAGWNAQPVRQSEHVEELSEQQVIQKFHAVDLDDDLPNRITPKGHKRADVPHNSSLDSRLSETEIHIS